MCMMINSIIFSVNGTKLLLPFMVTMDILVIRAAIQEMTVMHQVYHCKGGQFNFHGAWGPKGFDRG